MLKTTVINHKRTTRKRIKCIKCSLEYSKKDYGVLYENQKLAYFTFPPRSRNIFCHECFYNEMFSISEEREREIKILVQDGKNRYTINIGHVE